MIGTRHGEAWWSSNVMMKCLPWCGVGTRCNKWCSRQRYHVGIFILHPRHHRGYGWLMIRSRTMKKGNVVSILVLHVSLGDISLSICIWIECTIFALRFLTWKWAKICAKLFHILGLAHMRIGQTRIENKTWRSTLDRVTDADVSVWWLTSFAHCWEGGVGRGGVEATDAERQRPLASTSTPPEDSTMLDIGHVWWPRDGRVCWSETFLKLSE
jgi:hypothetical protein